MAAAHLALKKQTGPNAILIAARHNLRELQAEHGCVARIAHANTRLNTVLAGPSSARDVAAAANALMEAAGVERLRKDAVRGVEVVISLPTGCGIHEEFFTESLRWIRGFFQVPILSAVVHRDESAPHMHVLLLPIVDGRMKGSALVGNASRLRSMQTEFHEAVSARYGLSKPKQAKRLSVTERKVLAARAVEALCASSRWHQQNRVKEQLRALISQNPKPLAEELGVGLQKKGSKREFVRIMTRKVTRE